MMKIQAKKDGKGNIIISEDSFEMLLACLDNQKFVGEQPQNGDSLSVSEKEYWKGQEDIQNTIDHYNRQCREILHKPEIQPASDMLSCSKEELIGVLKEVLIGYEKNVGEYHESRYEYIQEKDLEQIAQDLIDYCSNIH